MVTAGAVQPGVVSGAQDPAALLIPDNYDVFVYAISINVKPRFYLEEFYLAVK